MNHEKIIYAILAAIVFLVLSILIAVDTVTQDVAAVRLIVESLR